MRLAKLLPLVRRFPLPKKQPSRMELWIRLTPIDANGVRGESVTYPSHSWVKAASRIMCVQLGGVASLSVVDMGGTSRTVIPNANVFLVTPTLGTTSATFRGIVVGTGTTAEDRDDSALATLIAEGTGSGQLTHGAGSSSAAPVAITGGYRLSITRTFTNSSGSAIVIGEIGLAFRNSVDATAIGFLGIRDVLSATHSVANGNSVLVEYLLDFLV